VSDRTEPLALPYYNARSAVPTSKIIREREDIERFARVEGFALGEWYIETADEPGSKLRALIAAARRRRATVVIVPTEADLGTDEATQQATREVLTKAGLRVLVLPQAGSAT
jgi:hypothetical protein